MCPLLYFADRPSHSQPQFKPPNWANPLRSPPIRPVMAEAIDPTTLKVFAELGEKFNLEDKVVTWLTSEKGLGARTLDDFLFSCDDPKEVKRMAREAEPENELMAVNRVRQAWHALNRSRDAAEEVNRVGQDRSGMDELLPSAVLDDIESRHWNRHKMTWPPDMSPADTVASRIVRELDKRTLGVREVFKIRTQTHQQKGMRKCTKLANGNEMLSAEAEEQEVRHTTQNYLAGLPPGCRPCSSPTARRTPSPGQTPQNPSLRPWTPP